MRSLPYLPVNLLRTKPRKAVTKKSYIYAQCILKSELTSLVIVLNVVWLLNLKSLSLKMRIKVILNFIFSSIGFG
ncbi:hypothetical protein K931_18202 [Aeromonas salmonicida subsp. pectinolytica 34mel]|nr:hypothetical protein K931_18202 [Aeromonas salmonicida subsp. pectinolytica 34mel]